ncbi:MAG TPA: heparinase II/III family protein [Paludibacteraceae bacterium]|nr:heparinase II/III family protein [Paludibacteraceae bacterium]
MKRTLINIIICITLIFFSINVSAQKLRSEVFDLINLEYPGLKEVKILYEERKNAEAAKALLKYYRTRTNIYHPEVDLKNLKISEKEKKWADDALEHTFFVHEGYQPSFNYGKDINWKYWPIKDNELRWQLHRQKWFIPMGKAYKITKDEKYAKEWIFQFMDWINKNPYALISKNEYEQKNLNIPFEDAKENAQFAWRPLEVSHRLEAQIEQFIYFIDSPNFTPEFLTEFLLNYHLHATHILHNYSEQGNHLLFEAQRMIYAGTFFPEFKDATLWRKSGIDILNKEINEQVYEDGGHFELDPHYHLAVINIFCKALQFTQANGFSNEFSAEFLNKVEKMIIFYMNISFPDYSNPCFSDAKLAEKREIINNYKKWSKIFPDNKEIEYFATEGKKGELPAYLSKGFLNSGFYVFRNSWTIPATVMVLKAGPQAFWHCQPDNGTFELWLNDENLFPDSGSYIYGGDDKVMSERNWFRQTKVHNTLTLNDSNYQNTNSKCLLWQPNGKVQKLVIETQCYDNLKHRRSVFFVDNNFFVIVDEAVGNGTGKVGIHYQLKEGEISLDKQKHSLVTCFPKNNIMLQCFSPDEICLKEEEGWYSTAYRKKKSRPAVVLETQKNANKPVSRFITIIYPMNDKEKNELFATFGNKNFDENGLKIQVKVNQKTYNLENHF